METVRQSSPIAAELAARGSSVVQNDPVFLSAVMMALLSETPWAVLIVDAEGQIVTVNDAFGEIWRLDVSEIVDDANDTYEARTLLNLLKERVVDEEGFLRRARELYHDPTLYEHSEVPLKDGRTIDRHSASLWGPAGEYLGRVWFFDDITDGKRASELAATDDLTGTANRRAFVAATRSALGRARAHESRVSVVMIDVDHFKTVNDTFGHAAGDQLLRACVDAWREVVRGDDLLARVGGDEFAVLMEGCAPAPARASAERLCERTRTVEVDLDGAAVTATVSIGVATSAAEEEGLDGVKTLLARADERLYAAKEAGRDQVHPQG